MTETLLLKNNSIELQICTVHKTKLKERYTTIHINLNGTLATPLLLLPPPKYDFLDETLLSLLHMALGTEELKTE